MPRRILITAHYQADAQQTFLAALNPLEMAEAMTGLARYDGLPDHLAKTGETWRVDVTMFGFFKTKGYAMFIESVDRDACVMQSREHGGAIKLWDHRLSVRQEGERAIWTDDVTLDAGLMTPFMARFGAYMYRRRHRYRRALSITAQIEKVLT
ncbi:MAG: hypothetical protein ACPGVT_14280 [Maricaulaceae bacterium]